MILLAWHEICAVARFAVGSMAYRPEAIYCMRYDSFEENIAVARARGSCNFSGTRSLSLATSVAQDCASLR